CVLLVPVQTGEREQEEREEYEEVHGGRLPERAVVVGHHRELRVLQRVAGRRGRLLTGCQRHLPGRAELDDRVLRVVPQQVPGAAAGDVRVERLAVDLGEVVGRRRELGERLYRRRLTRDLRRGDERGIHRRPQVGELLLVHAGA